VSEGNKFEYKIVVTVAAYTCKRCGALNKVVQSGEYLKAPKYCVVCRETGPFVYNREQSEFETCMGCVDCKYGQMPYTKVSEKFLSVCRNCDCNRGNWKPLTENQKNYLKYVQEQDGSCRTCRYCDTFSCDMSFRPWQKQFCSGYRKRKEVS